MVKGLLKKLTKSIADAYDPDREERAKRVAARLLHGLKSKGKNFNLRDELAEDELSKSDISRAKELAFRHVLENVWKDGVISKKERETAAWVEQCLEFSKTDGLAIRKQYAIEQFRTALALAMDDGIVTDEEFRFLDHVASSVEESTPSMMRAFFIAEGEGFLRAMFLDSIEGGSLSRESWDTLLSTSLKLGISESDLHHCIGASATQFIEHVLADAKADGELSSQERDEIESLLAMLGQGGTFAEYVRREMQEFEMRSAIAAGRLPSISVPSGFELRSGEIVHAHANAELMIVRNLKSGQNVDRHHGEIVVLDSRAIFRGSTRAEVINYRKLVLLRDNATWLDFQLTGKPVWSLRVPNGHPFFPLIFCKAVSLANQTSVRSITGEQPRTIPRDVRQRIWQKYGGQCADCGAREYLEFDHIIPYAKGGNNSDSNVQLLCRGCNLRKSDHI